VPKKSVARVMLILKLFILKLSLVERLVPRKA